MPQSGDVDLVWPSCEERDVRDERVITRDDSPIVVLFFAGNITYQTSPRPIHMLARLLKFPLDLWRDEWVPVDLTVRVVERDANRLALILKDKHIVHEVDRT